MHDIYCRELSDKVRQSYISKTMNGEFLCGSPPFGFVKSSSGNNRLEVDSDAAETVRRMRMGKDACSSHYIVEKDLEELVVGEIRDIASEILQDENAIRKRFYAVKARDSASQLNTDKTALKKVKKRLAELDKLLQVAFEKSVLGGDSSEMFTSLAQKYKGEKEDLLTQVNRLTLSIDKRSRAENDVDIFISLMKKHANITTLDRDTALELIDYITISAFAVTPREISIHYKFMGTVE